MKNIKNKNNIINKKTNNNLIKNKNENKLINKKTNNNLIRNKNENKLINKKTNNNLIKNKNENKLINKKTNNNLKKNKNENKLINKKTNNNLIKNKNKLINKKSDNNLIKNKNENKLINKKTDNNLIKNKNENKLINKKTNNILIKKILNNYKILTIKNKIKILNKNFLKIKKIKNNIIEGEFLEKDFFSPSYINFNNPKFLEIDDYFYSGLIIVNYFRENRDLILKTLLETNINMNISIFYEKCETQKILKELTYNIGNVGYELKKSNDNRQDIDIAESSYNDAKYIRKEIQLNNEELYYLYIYINLFSNDKKELFYNIDKIEGILQSRGMQTKRANFREEQLFLSCLPLLENNRDLKTVGKRNILTSGLVCTYPFMSSSIFDDEGIYIGNNMYNNSIVLIDRYNTEKYKNANMCIFGTSGAGKSYYTKAIILRNVLLGIDQYVIDPEREYANLANNLNGTIIKLGTTSENFINVFDIRKESIEENEHGYLATKIGKLIGFFNLIFGELNEEEKAVLEEKIIEVYKLKGINFNDNSLYKNNNFKTTKDMPILEDFYNILTEEKNKKFKIKLIPFIKGSLKFFNNYTNIELNNKLIVADVYELGEDNMKYGMYLFVELFWDKIKVNRNIKKAIYLDEIWRLIGVTSNKDVAKFIYKIFKTIRKYGGSSVAITQDISDLFSLDDGAYGKSILNNSSIKTFFSLEEENIKLLSQYSNISEKEKMEIKSLRRGECLTFVGDEHILINVEVSDYEKHLIENKKIFN